MKGNFRLIELYLWKSEIVMKLLLFYIESKSARSPCLSLHAHYCRQQLSRNLVMSTCSRWIQTWSEDVNNCAEQVRLDFSQKRRRALIIITWICGDNVCGVRFEGGAFGCH